MISILSGHKAITEWKLRACGILLTDETCRTSSMASISWTISVGILPIDLDYFKKLSYLLFRSSISSTSGQIGNGSVSGATRIHPEMHHAGKGSIRVRASPPKMVVRVTSVP